MRYVFLQEDKPGDYGHPDNVRHAEGDKEQHHRPTTAETIETPLATHVQRTERAVTPPFRN
jgi:hypothetical protein